MAKSFEKMSLSELEEAIASKRSELQSRREELMEELSSIDSVLGAMGTGSGGSAPAKRGPGRPKGSKNAGVAKKGGKGGRRGPRPKNDMSMKEAITKALEGKKGGLTLDEVAEGVKAIGYKSNSANFKNVVYQNLYGNKEMFPKNDDGKYTLSS